MGERFRVVIIGSGPAGLSAAAHAAERGLSHLLLEKTDHLADTIFRFQRRKDVMATPSQLELRAWSGCAFSPSKREMVLESWDAAAKAVNVRYRAEAVSVAGEKGAFSVGLANGEAVEAETVVVAIGTQGNPNRMSCEGAAAPHVQYQLDDPAAYVDEHIFVIGGGDAGIENALGVAEDPAQANTVSLVNRSAEFETAKAANVAKLMKAAEAGRMSILRSTTTSKVEPGWITVETPEGPARLPCDRIIARMGSAPPRKFVEGLYRLADGPGIKFTSERRDAYPQLTPSFETTVPGIYVIGALAGYPLIKHCLNQGYDVVEYIAGNLELKPADEPILERKFAGLPGGLSVADRLEFLRERVNIFRGLSPLQMRELMLDSEARAYRAGQTVFERNAIGSSLFAIAEGSVRVEVDRKDRSKAVSIGAGSIVGEVGLISGRRRGATVRAAADCILVELSRTAALKLMATNQDARAAVDRITTERQLLQIFGSGLSARDIDPVIDSAQVMQVKAGETIMREGDEGRDIFIIRSGSMVVEKEIGGKPVFLSYVPAGSYSGEMALLEGGRRTATVRAAIRSEVIRLDGAAFAELLARKPDLARRVKSDMADRRRINAFVEERKNGFGGVADMYTALAGFLVTQGIGDATDVLLIDETLCIGCDNCEKACADTHDGLSRLDREAGRTYAHLHVPTSCRHCEHPYCMADCPPDAIHRGPDGEVFIEDSCIGCGNCQRNCPYDVIRMDKIPPKKPALLSWMLFGRGPGPGEPDHEWREGHAKAGVETPKMAIKCDMCAGRKGGPACVRACPTGAAIRVSPEEFLSVTLMERGRG